MTVNLKNIFEEPFFVEQNFQSKSETKYKIKMDNYYLNSMGRVYKLQKLHSDFTRKIEEVYEGATMLSTYRWNHVRFENKTPKQDPVISDWGFIKDKTFQYLLILSNEKLLEIITRNNLNQSNEVHKNCFQLIESEYSGLPKLPSSYLVIMQTFDIIAFETYLSYIHAYNCTNNGWKLDEWIKIDPPELEHTEAANIGFGMYSDNSYFRNGKFHIKFTGYGKAKGNPCAIFDYYCDYSQVKMQNKEIANLQRQGTSYYHGQIWININSGDLERGTMLESYIALQEGVVKTPMNIRRKVICEAFVGEEA